MIVVLRALGLGDLLAAVPALRAIRRGAPDERVVLAGPPGLAPIASWSGAVDHVVPTTGLDQPLPPLLRGARLACNLHGRGPQSARLLDSIRPEHFVGFRHPAVRVTPAGPEWDEEEHEVDRWCRLVDRAGFTAHPGDLRLPVPEAHGAARRGATAVPPGAASAARRWPSDRWAVLVRRLLASDRRVVVTGGPADRDAVDALRAEVPADPKLSFLETVRVDHLAAVIAHAGLLVCGDTGPAHLATAFGT